MLCSVIEHSHVQVMEQRKVSAEDQYTARYELKFTIGQDEGDGQLGLSDNCDHEGGSNHEECLEDERDGINLYMDAYFKFDRVWLEFYVRHKMWIAHVIKRWPPKCKSP